jgi:ADP-ribosylation factor-like protein 8
MGFRRTATVSEYVGTILSRRQRYPVRKTRGRVVNESSYVVDAADAERIPESKEELFELLDRPVLAGIPLLVLGNKNDLPEAITVEKLIDEMFPPSEIKALTVRDLKKVEGREVSCYSISAKESMNLDAVFKWLIARFPPSSNI